jgi:glutamate--cysteine ligase
VLSIEQMVSHFRPNSTRDYELLVGFEYEVQLLRRRDLSPLGYRGEPGLEDIFAFAAEQLDGQLEPGDPPNKLSFGAGAQLSLEPGGQLELSSAPVATFAGCMAQLERFLQLLEQIADRFDVHVFYGGANPVHTVEQIGLVIPNHRYQLMDQYFPRVGSMGRRMMRQTCSLQVTFDYQNATLGRQLLRSGSIVAPIAAALFANAPFIDGKDTGHRSFRIPIWRDTDPARCGPLPGGTRSGYGFGDYVAYVMRAPMFFVSTEQGLVDARGITFEQFNRQGYLGRTATVDDFLLHNSTIFSDVRLKNTVEVRTVDAQDPALVPAALAFLCGLLLCEGARARTLTAVEQLGLDPSVLGAEIGRQGLSGHVAGRPIRDLMLFLLEQAEQGLRSCFEDGREAGSHLDRLAELVDAEKTPADIVLERFGGDPQAWLAAGRTFSCASEASTLL